MNVKYDAIFAKKGDMVYISHLDLMMLLTRAIRRTELPFSLSQGFTPRLRLSIPKALKLGRASDSEEMSFWLEEELPAADLAEVINRRLPEGIRITKVNKCGK
ncbi:MAG: TIGR03936 family radical SAM-associated protein [Candidatus Omnitrophota bacterium]